MMFEMLSCFLVIANGSSALGCLSAKFFSAQEIVTCFLASQVLDECCARFSGTNSEKQHGSEAETGNAQEGRKRKRSTTDGEGEMTNFEHRLIEALEKNGRLLSSQLEAQNSQLVLDREQRNEHVNSLITVLNKFADALGRIADKL